MMARSRSLRSGLALLAMLAACASLPACEGFLSSSKTAQGQLYHSDDQRYDPYFDSIHQQQVAAAGWPDEKKTARRPLINALSLTPGASEETIVSATRERAKKLGAGGAKLDIATAHVTPVGGANDGPLFSAVEETARLELERARKLKAASDKLEEMAKKGEELKKTADHEFENRGADKADEKKTEKSRELRRELGGAIDSMRSLAHDATKGATNAQDFLEDLESAIEAKDPPPRGKRPESKPLPPPPPPKAEPPKEEPKPAPVAKPKAAPAAKPKPADKPAEAPAKPPPPPPDEVFNP